LQDSPAGYEFGGGGFAEPPNCPEFLTIKLGIAFAARWTTLDVYLQTGS
jgi:hypothetical protein